MSWAAAGNLGTAIGLAGEVNSLITTGNFSFRDATNADILARLDALSAQIDQGFQDLTETIYRSDLNAAVDDAQTVFAQLSRVNAGTLTLDANGELLLSNQAIDAYSAVYDQVVELIAVSDANPLSADLMAAVYTAATFVMTLQLQYSATLNDGAIGEAVLSDQLIDMANAITQSDYTLRRTLEVNIEVTVERGLYWIESASSRYDGASDAVIYAAIETVLNSGVFTQSNLSVTWQPGLLGTVFSQETITDWGDLFPTDPMYSDATAGLIARQPSLVTSQFEHRNWMAEVMSVLVTEEVMRATGALDRARELQLQAHEWALLSNGSQIVDPVGAGGNVIGGTAYFDFLIGNDGDDTMFGGDRADVIYGGGNDPLNYDLTTYGDDGNDRVYAGPGMDLVRGGTGNDLLVGGGGNDTLYGGAGDDDLWGSSGLNTFAGMLGADSLFGGSGNDVIWIDDPFQSLGYQATTYKLDDDGEFERDLQGNKIWIGDKADGGEGNDTIYGSINDDRIEGGAGNDLLWGERGMDMLEGGIGDDRLRGDSGNDTLLGGAGNDTLFGDIDPFGNIDLIYSEDQISNISSTVDGAENDRLEGGEGEDLLLGGQGQDSLYGDGGKDRLFGGDGDDTLNGDGGDDLLVGGSGMDSIHGGIGDDSLSGGADSDTLNGAVGADVIEGGDGDDSISGGDGDDRGYGGDGADTLTGGAGDDFLFGEFDDFIVDGANDSIDGGSGDDYLDGGGGADTIDGGIGHDTLLGWAGADSLTGGDGFDLLLGFDDSDTLDGGSGNDSMRGGLDADTLRGGDGDDTMRGDDRSGLEEAGGNDLLEGDDGNDLISGGYGADTLNGGAGNDTLDGGFGADTMNGGSGNDRFVVAGTDAVMFADQINGGTGTDVLDLRGLNSVYTVVPDAVGSDSGRIDITAGDGTTVSQTYTSIETILEAGDTDPSGDFPVADSDSGRVDLATQTTASGDVLANDTDPFAAANQQLSVTGARPGAEQDGGLLSVVTSSVTLLGTYGSLLLNADGNYTYTVDPTDPDTQGIEYSERDTFTYEVSDEDGLTDLTQLAITVVQLDDEPSDSFGGGATEVPLPLEVLPNEEEPVVIVPDPEPQVDPITNAVVNSRPTGEITITGTTAEGRTLTAESSLSDLNGLGEFSFQWLRGTEEIDGATGTTYVAVSDDIGEALSVRVSYTDGAATDETVLSAPTDPIDNTNDLPTGAVVITGTAAFGQTLTADTDTDPVEDADGLGAFSYQWLRGDRVIAGAEAASYTLVRADAGTDVRVRVSYTDGFGTQEAVRSEPVSVDPDLQISGGEGPETLTGSLGNDTLSGGAGDDSVSGGEGSDDLRGGPDNDTLVGGNGFDSLNGGLGDDSLQGNFGNDTLRGGAGNDTLEGGLGFDSLVGDAGDDFLQGRDGFDTLEGGAGNDSLEGNSGNDSLSGGTGNDTLVGGLGFDDLSGDEGNDLLQGLDGFDTLSGGEGEDTLEGNNGNDSLLGDAGDDRLEGGLGSDTMSGGDDNDTLLGANGFDVLLGDAGDDLLEGNAGNDTMDGGLGNDTMRGGLGADTFQFRAGADRISDFQNNVDHIEIAASLLAETAPVEADLLNYASVDAAGNVVLDFGLGQTLTISGVTNANAILDDVTLI